PYPCPFPHSFPALDAWSDAPTRFEDDANPASCYALWHPTPRPRPPMRPLIPLLILALLLTACSNDDPQHGQPDPDVTDTADAADTDPGDTVDAPGDIDVDVPPADVPDTADVPPHDVFDADALAPA